MSTALDERLKKEIVSGRHHYIQNSETFNKSTVIHPSALLPIHPYMDKVFQLYLMYNY